MKEMANKGRNKEQSIIDQLRIKKDYYNLSKQAEFILDPEEIKQMQ